MSTLTKWLLFAGAACLGEACMANDSPVNKLSNRDYLLWLRSVIFINTKLVLYNEAV